MYYLCIESKGSDQMGGYRSAHLRFVFTNAKKMLSHDKPHLMFAILHVFEQQFISDHPR